MASNRRQSCARSLISRQRLGQCSRPMCPVRPWWSMAIRKLREGRLILRVIWELVLLSDAWPPLKIGGRSGASI
jgi:hypothetical protein